MDQTFEAGNTVENTQTTLTTTKQMCALVKCSVQVAININLELNERRAQKL